ncbi:methyltransferase domain-containing protein [Methanolobus mangrovi]|uniref:Methyltransferase domain-containing protein n=1 Tax=Methanolobus mangrovi TaxID=3072977 RepID=A0AA51YGR0_9EURY|nr:methyltransferase domain-containing protein [Methanolobus mangrovi]WMW22322.1 methyltransferase domain-containing protein [Methanolobus mangrovi]
MVKRKLTISEIEKMKYYDFMTYIGVPYFHIGGPRSTEELADLCSINKNSIVLMVGCGNGFSACHLAKKTGCFVVGVDIASLSIENARQRAINDNVENMTEFIIGDAYNLPFRKDSFDFVITEFVSQFLDKDRAFHEFIRVLKVGGILGINEMYRDNAIEPQMKTKIDEAEIIFTEVTELPFKMNTPDEWKRFFEEAGFTDIGIHQRRPFQKIKDITSTIKAMGGIVKITCLIYSMLKCMILSKIIRKRFSKLDKGKRILFNNRTTRKHVGYILGIARKPNK